MSLRRARISLVLFAAGGTLCPCPAAAQTAREAALGKALAREQADEASAVVDALAALLYDADPTTRKRGLHELRPFQAAALDALIAAFRSDDPVIHNDGELRHGLLTAIMVINDPRVAPVLREAVRDSHAQVRGTALSFLLHRQPDAFDDPELAALVLDAAADPALEVRYGALNALQNAYDRGVNFDRRRIAEAVLPALDDPSLDIRLQAIHVLGQWRIAEGVDRLARLLDAPDDQVQGAAVLALARIGDARAIPRLRALLATQETLFIYAVGELHDRESVPALIDLLAAGPPPARQAAATVLGKIRDPRAVEPLIAALGDGGQHQHEAARALGQIGDPRAVEPLIELTHMWPGLFGGQRFRRFDDVVSPDSHPASWPLQELAPLAVDKIAAMLSDDHVHTREVGAWVLDNFQFAADDAMIDMQPAIEPLVAALADENVTVRQHAALALGRRGDRRAAPALIELIAAGGGEDRYWYPGFNAAAYLSRIRDPATAPPLVALLTSNRPNVRSCAARALGYLKAEQAEGALLTLLDDAVPAVRAEAAGALGRLRAAAAVEPLIAALADGASDLRAAAAEALGRVGETPQAAVAPPASDAVRIAGALVRLYDDGEFAVRVAAGLALVRIDDERGALILARALADDDKQNRERAATAISTVFLSSPRLVPVLVNALDDPEVRVRLYVADALGRIGGDAAVDALLARLDDRENLRAIIQALGATKDERALPQLIVHLDDEHPAFRSAAVAQVADSAIPNRAELLAARLGDPDRQVRLSAIAALVRIKAVAALPALEQLVDDADPQVAAYAALAVKQLR